MAQKTKRPLPPPKGPTPKMAPMAQFGGGKKTAKFPK